MCPYQNAAKVTPHAIDSKLGFCPKSPLSTQFSPALEALRCGEWLTVAQDLHKRLLSRTLRSDVEALPLITLPEDQNAMSLDDRRLAYVCLTFLEHAYVWGDHVNGEEPAQALPVQIAAPLRQVCKMLGTQPCLTYTSTLWNWTGPTAERRTMFSFTGLPDESYFYLTLLDVEEAGGDALRHGTEAERWAKAGKNEEVAKCLMEMATALERCKVALERVRKGCSPSAFFVNMRPYLSGFSSRETFPNGVFFHTSASEGVPEHFEGATGGQSPLFQAIDSVLGVSHQSPQSKEYVGKMRCAMWKPHSDLVSELGNVSTLVAYVKSVHANGTVMAAYNSAITALKAWRHVHIQIVTSYIIQQANRTGQRERGATGTASGNLMDLLKSMRDTTAGCTVAERSCRATSPTLVSRTPLHGCGRSFTTVFIASFAFAAFCAAKAYEIS